MNLRETYWPESASGDYLDTARRRSLIVFSLLGAAVCLAVNVAYFEKNFYEYPAQGICVSLIAIYLIVSPILMRRCDRVETAALIVVWSCFALLGGLTLFVDGMISLKAIFFLPLAMVMTLTLSWRHGLLFGLASVLLYIGIHSSRDSISGNMVANLTADELSLMMTIGLSIAITFVITGAAIFSEQMTAAMRKLKQANRAAQASNHAKTQFLANMSHELRTPMHGVLGLAELLEASPLNNEQRHYVATVKDSASTLVVILNDVLDAARLESSQLELRNEPFNLRAMCENVCLLFSREAQRKKLTLSVDYADSLPDHLFGDADRLRQILMNLVANAIKFTDAGYVSVQVFGDTDDTSTRLQIAVADSGIGVPDDQAELIFERFAQATSNPDKGGAGLGLSICRGLAHAMGGHLLLSRNRPRGSVFSLTLELAHAPVASRPNASAAEDAGIDEFFVTSNTRSQPLPNERTAQSGANSILIAEDNEVNRMFLTHFLRGRNLSFEFAENGAVAVEKVRDSHYDLILMDISMPLLSGIEATRQIREFENETGRAQCPIVAVTASAIAGDRERFLEAGMNDYLAKPYRIEEFQKMLGHWLPDLENETKSHKTQ